MPEACERSLMGFLVDLFKLYSPEHKYDLATCNNFSLVLVM